MAPRKAPDGILAHGKEFVPPKPKPAKKAPPPTPQIDRKTVEQQIAEAFTDIMRANNMGRKDLKRMEAYISMVMRAARSPRGWFNVHFPPGGG